MCGNVPVKKLSCAGAERRRASAGRDAVHFPNYTLETVVSFSPFHIGGHFQSDKLSAMSPGVSDALPLRPPDNRGFLDRDAQCHVVPRLLRQKMRELRAGMSASDVS